MTVSRKGAIGVKAISRDELSRLKVAVRLAVVQRREDGRGDSAITRKLDAVDDLLTQLQSSLDFDGAVMLVRENAWQPEETPKTVDEAVEKFRRVA